MSAGMPELGSKISLISKADIRYEGRLFTVDPQECTIALANVRSFGTEDRETPYPIMPQPTVYDYILFRGSDIKDIRVVNNIALPNDPAIMQMHMPPGQMPPQQNFTPQNFPPMQGQPGGAPMGQFGPFGGMQGGNMGPSMSGNMPQQQQAQSPVQQDSRSGTPQNMSRKSPTSDMGVQTNQNREGQAGGNKDKPQRNNQRNNQPQQQQRERRDSGRNEGNQENKGGYRNQNQRPNHQMNNNNQQQQHHQQQNRGGYNNRDNRDNRNGGDNRNNNGNNQIRGNQGGSARMRGPPMHMNSYRQQNNQGAPIPNNIQNKPNTSGPQQQQLQQNRGNSKQLKFENEFDFEQANSKFEELRTQLSKLKVGSEETKTPEQVNGEVEKKDDSGNETGADNHEVDVDDPGYDKTKSFFDNISCEAVERSKGKTQRTDWRQERKINSETFGYSFNRRGNFRGRGGYYQNQYNRGPRQGGYRGGNPNYRPMRNHRNQNNADGRNPAPVNNGQQQSQNQSAPVAAN